MFSGVFSLCPFSSVSPRTKWKLNRSVPVVSLFKILIFANMDVPVIVCCVYVNVKKSKTTDKLSEKGRNNGCSYCFQACPL